MMMMATTGMMMVIRGTTVRRLQRLITVMLVLVLAAAKITVMMLGSVAMMIMAAHLAVLFVRVILTARTLWSASAANASMVMRILEVLLLLLATWHKLLAAGHQMPMVACQCWHLVLLRLLLLVRLHHLMLLMMMVGRHILGRVTRAAGRPTGAR